MRNGTLHAALEAFTVDVSAALESERAGGAEVAFDVVEEAGGPTPLYCYRTLTRDFIGDRLGLLTALPTYAAAARALEAIEATGAYLRRRGVANVPSAPRERGKEALELFLASVFADRSHFEFDAARFDAAFVELESALYEGQSVTTVIAPLLGVLFDNATRKVALGDGLALVRGEAFDGAPFEAVWGEGEPSVLAVFTVVQDRGDPAPVAVARSALRRVVTTLRLFEPGRYALGPTAWMRVDAGQWRPLALPFTGDPGPPAVITAQHEDELRGFFNLVARRAAANGHVEWALARFEMAAERAEPLQALTDYLMAARGLLEPGGPGAGWLAPRLAAICAPPEDRERVGERVAAAETLERLVISGVSPSDGASELVVSELCELVRALLRDILCGHLDGDICALAEQLIAEAGAEPAGGLRLDKVGLGVDG